MPEDREELLRHYRESREKLLATIEGLTDDEMSEPSIDGWSVKDHLAHMALWDDIRTAEVDHSNWWSAVDSNTCLRRNTLCALWVQEWELN